MDGASSFQNPTPVRGDIFSDFKLDEKKNVDSEENVASEGGVAFENEKPSGSLNNTNDKKPKDFSYLIRDKAHSSSKAKKDPEKSRMAFQAKETIFKTWGLNSDDSSYLVSQTGFKVQKTAEFSHKSTDQLKNRLVKLKSSVETLSSSDEVDEESVSKISSKIIKGLDKASSKFYVKTNAFINKVSNTIFVNFEKLTDEEKETLEELKSHAESIGMKVKLVSKKEFKEEALKTILISGHGNKILSNLHQHYSSTIDDLKHRQITIQSARGKLNPFNSLYRKHSGDYWKHRVSVQSAGSFTIANPNLYLHKRERKDGLNSSLNDYSSLSIQFEEQKKAKDKSKERDDRQIRAQEAKKENIKKEIQEKSNQQGSIDKKRKKEENPGEVVEIVKKVKIKADGKLHHTSNLIDINTHSSKRPI